MEPWIAEWINNPKMPKWLRYSIVTLVCGFVMFLGGMLVWKSPMLAGKIFGGVLSVLFLAASIYLFQKIAKCKHTEMLYHSSAFSKKAPLPSGARIRN